MKIHAYSIAAMLLACHGLGCNLLLGTEPGDYAPLVLASPADGETLAGPAVTLTWSGGLAAYEIDVAFDPDFREPVPGLSPLVSERPEVRVEGLSGGYFYWRVRCPSCGPNVASEVQEIHVTCAPVLLAEAPALGPMSAAVAWNAVDHEYGIIFADGAPAKLQFVRTDALGRVVFGPAPVTDPPQLAPALTKSSGAHDPTLAYVASHDRWAVAYRMAREGTEDHSYAFLFDDEGRILSDRPLNSGFDAELHSITYSEHHDRIIMITDHAGIAPEAGDSYPYLWSPRVEIFDADLSAIGGAIDVSQGQALYPSLALLPDLEGGGDQALVSFTHMDLEGNRTDHLAMQRLDLATGELRWPAGISTPRVAGKIVAPGVRLFSQSRLAWMPEAELAAFTYTDRGPTKPAYRSDAYIGLLDPRTGELRSPPRHLNAAAPRATYVYGAPQAAWDGEELLVLWNDDRDGDGEGQVRMSRMDGAGTPIVEDVLLRPEPGRTLVAMVGQAVVGHDRIHAVVYSHNASPEDPNGLWLCIEPPPG